MKNRDNIYLVVRTDVWPVDHHAHICGVYRTHEAAQTAADRSNQQWKDRGWESQHIFNVRISTYYDE